MIENSKSVEYISRINEINFSSQVDDDKILSASGNEVIKINDLKSNTVKKTGEINLQKSIEIAVKYLEDNFKISFHEKLPVWELVSAKIVDNDSDKGSRFYLIEFSSRDNSKPQHEYSRDYLSIIVLFSGELIPCKKIMTKK